ncbi:MAG: hypothetical protein J4F36_14200, partial [Nitrosopumilaceae archaeon]|nr:hypothetical protein [Nitrosopumilaceae archaeon]
MWAVTTALHYEEIKNPERVTKKYSVSKKIFEFSKNYNWDGLEFPMAVNKIKKFEQNNNDIAVNVLAVTDDKKGFYILRRSRFNATRSNIINLLLIEDGANKHYVFIKNLSRLLGSTVTKCEHKQYYCINCLNFFNCEESHNEHYEYCVNNEPMNLILPSKQDCIKKYHDGHKQFKVPFSLYFDFECIIDEMGEHIPCGFSVYSKFSYGSVPDSLKVYRGEDCVKKFIDYIQEEVKRLYAMFPPKAKLELSSDEKQQYRDAKTCHICKKVFNDPQNNRKVQDHCHYTGQYRGAAHNNCNLRYRIPNFINIESHNLSGYDAHLIIRELARQFNTDDIGCIAENHEKYISFNVKMPVPVGDVFDTNGNQVVKKVELRFIDSIRFMQSSLSSLVDNLAGTNPNEDVFCKGCKNMMEMIEIDDSYTARFKCQKCYCSYASRQLNENLLKILFSSVYEYCGGDDLKFRLLLRKGAYPYEYMDSMERFKETSLPCKKAFYSELNLKEISDLDYKHAEKVWKAFSLKDLGDYHDVYLASDTLLLCDVFENFRDTCFEHYKLDPAHFYTAPGLSEVAAMKCTGVELELITDVNMLLMVERGIRGGLTQAVHRYAAANNTYMEDLYDPKKESSYLQYLDANNLYGWAMTQKLPTGGFEWMTDVDRLTPELIEVLSEKEDHGYLLEVDVDYPSELHDAHNELPFLPEKMKIDKVEKLVPNLFDKNKYIVHIRALNQALKHGLILKKVHRGIKFKHSNWLKPYIDLNTKLRMEAKNEFEKNFFKLMNNSFFGKTMENLRKRRNIRLITNKKAYEKAVMKVNFKGANRFSEDLMSIELGYIKLMMNKPIYLGQTILDLSKMVMYEFHYDYIKPKYGSKAQLCYMDTDSLIYHIKTEDFYKDIANDVKKRFDTSNFSVNRPLPIGVNKKVIPMFKSELGAMIMIEFIALR